MGSYGARCQLLPVRASYFTRLVSLTHTNSPDPRRPAKPRQGWSRLSSHEFRFQLVCSLTAAFPVGVIHHVGISRSK